MSYAGLLGYVGSKASCFLTVDDDRRRKPTVSTFCALSKGALTPRGLKKPAPLPSNFQLFIHFYIFLIILTERVANMKINQIIDQVDSKLDVKLDVKERNALHTRIYNYLNREHIPHRKRGRAVTVVKEEAKPVIEYFSQEISQKRKTKTAVSDAEAVQIENEKLKKKIRELEEENTNLHKRVDSLTDKVFRYADLMGDKLEELNKNKGKKEVKSKSNDSSGSKRRSK